MDIEMMEKQRIEWAAKGRALVEAAKGQGRDLDTEEQRNFEDYVAHANALQKDIEREQALRAHEERMNMSHEKPTKPELSEREPAGSPARFRSLGEQLQAVIRASRPGGFTDPRLTSRAITGMSESVPADGGFLVQTDFASELMKKVYETGQIASRCRRVQVGANSNGIKINAVKETSRANGSRFGGVQGYWLNEGGTKTASQPEFRQIELNLKKLIGLCYVTDELLQDASALESVVMSAFADEFAFKLDDAIFNGTGGVMPLGILSAANASLVSVEKENGQPADTLQPENIIKMWSRCIASSRQNAVWFINQDIEPQLFTLAIAVGTGGGTVYMPPGGLSGQPYGTLFGRPVIAVEQCDTLGDKGDIVLADMSQYLLIEKGGLQSASSIHVKFTTDETAFRFVYRVDGQPLWEAALTPFSGSTNTLSPFVTLDARA